MKSVVIVGGGFVGINAAKGLARCRDVEITLIDRRNHHLFQPLLYQVAMAGLSPADIAVPIRSLFARNRNIRVLQGEVQRVDLARSVVVTTFGEVPYDYLILGCGSRHSYFGHNDWERLAPGLKTIEQATEIRRRVLMAFEQAELAVEPAQRKSLLTFVIVGGGPTGVELAGAIGEMTRFTLARDFRNIDAKLARILLVEAGPRILPSFSTELAGRAARDLEGMGVQIWTDSRVTAIDPQGISLGDERIDAATVLWAAGVEASALGKSLPGETDRAGRVRVEPTLSLPNHPNVFVAGDMALVLDAEGKPLPGTAPVALQQGWYLGRTIRNDLRGLPRKPFHFVDKGHMATIGRSRAIVQIGKLQLAGRLAWFLWLLVHIYYLTGFRNRLFVVFQWAWSYITFRRGARLIVDKEWQFHRNATAPPLTASSPAAPTAPRPNGSTA